MNTPIHCLFLALGFSFLTGLITSCGNSQKGYSGGPIVLKNPGYSERPYRKNRIILQRPSRSYQNIKQPEPPNSGVKKQTVDQYINSADMFSTPNDLSIPSATQVTEGTAPYESPNLNGPSTTIKPPTSQ